MMSRKEQLIRRLAPTPTANQVSVVPADFTSSLSLWISSKFWLLILWRSGMLSVRSWPMMLSNGDAAMPVVFLIVSP